MRIGIAGGRPVAFEGNSFHEVNGVVDFDPAIGLTSIISQLAEISVGPEIAGTVELSAPFPQPSQIFAVGLNYRRHAHEMNLALPTRPMIFTKFPSSVASPNADVTIPGDTTDWEAELVIVIGKTVRNVSVEDASDVILGYMVGQDISERTVQMANNPAQFSLGKSYENFAPMGPFLTTKDEIHDVQDLLITCSLNGTVMQNESTADMAFGVAEIVSYISQVCQLRAGDLIFTGSPAGVGQGLTPPRFLQPDDVVVTTIEGLGTIRNVFRRLQ